MKRQLIISFLKVLAIGGMIVFGLSSCSKKVTTTTSVVRDSVSTVTTITPRDTSIRIGGDSIETALTLVGLPVYHDPGTPPALVTQSATGQRSKIELVQVGNKVTAKCICPEAEYKAMLYDKMVTNKFDHVEIVEKRIPERYIPKFTLWMSYVGIAALIILLAWIIVKVFKPFKLI